MASGSFLRGCASTIHKNTRRGAALLSAPDLYTSLQMSARPLLGRLLLALGSSAVLVLALAAAEWAARRLEPQYLARTRGMFVSSRVYGWAGRPGAVMAMGGGRMSLDARGYRGPALDGPKSPGRTRVVVLGDSIASGYGVSDEQTFPYLLHVRDNGLEVRNLGVEGYGPGQELLVLRQEALRLEPDVVVLALCLRNDFVDVVLPVALYDGVTPRPVFRFAGDRLVLDDTPVRRSAAARAVQDLRDYSHLFNRASALLPRRPAEAEVSWRQRKHDALADEEYAFRLTLELVLEMERVCRARGISFLVTTFPNGLSYVMKPRLQERLHEALRSRGVRVIDMGSRFRALALRPPELALDDVGHLAPRGHQVSSEILERAIATRPIAH